MFSYILHQITLDQGPLFGVSILGSKNRSRGVTPMSNPRSMAYKKSIQTARFTRREVTLTPSVSMTPSVCTCRVGLT